MWHTSTSMRWDGFGRSLFCDHILLQRLQQITICICDMIFRLTDNACGLGKAAASSLIQARDVITVDRRKTTWKMIGDDLICLPIVTCHTMSELDRCD